MICMRSFNVTTELYVIYLFTHLHYAIVDLFLEHFIRIPNLTLWCVQCSNRILYYTTIFISLAILFTDSYFATAFIRYARQQAVLSKLIDNFYYSFCNARINWICLIYYACTVSHFGIWSIIKNWPPYALSVVYEIYWLCVTSERVDEKNGTGRRNSWKRSQPTFPVPSIVSS